MNLQSNRSTSIKEKLAARLQVEMQEKLLEFSKQIQNIKSARGQEEKSSAGDKYETGRAMAQIELEKVEKQHKILEQQIQAMQKISLLEDSNSVKLGSLVISTLGNFLISIPFGKIVLDDKIYHCISTEAPIAKVMQHAKIGEEISFNGNNIKILELL